MRITKVKVDDKMVLMHRETRKGKLVFEKDANKNDEKDALLPEKKIDSFILSIRNKTLVKKVNIPKCENCKHKDRKEKLCQKCIDKRNFILGNRRAKPKPVVGLYVFLSKIIEATLTRKAVNLNSDVLRKATKADVELCLNHKFLKPVVYMIDDKACSFELSDLIIQAIKTNDPSKLSPYVDWAEWHIITKSKLIKKSIENNKINLHNESPRKKALALWESEFQQSGRINLSSFHNKYMIDILASDLKTVETGSFKDNGLQIRKNEYNRNLKSLLQNHQAKAEIFGKKDYPNISNRENVQFKTYHLEVVKYLEHYFPVKKSGRTNKKSDIDHYLKCETIKYSIENQLQNAIRLNILQKGKFQIHGINENSTSDDLSSIKRNEAFVLNLIGACAFASNNIRNIVDVSQTNDILHEEHFETSINKKNYNNELFRTFFDRNLIDSSISQVETFTTLSALRGSVQKIRNNIIHYKKNALSKIFNIEAFTVFSIDNVREEQFNATVFKDVLQNEINNLSKTLAEQLGSGGVLEYYDFEKLIGILNKCRFSLCRSSLPFTPGFKKVFKQGCRFQHAEKGSDFYDLKLTNFFPQTQLSNDGKTKIVENENQYQARYFLLKLIYNNYFLHSFTQSNDLFGNAVRFVLKVNREQAERSNQKDKQAFKEIPEFNNNSSVAEYMADVQSSLMIELNKKSQNQDSAEDEIKLNFEKFLIQVFIKGFDSFLTVNLSPDIHSPEHQFDGMDVDVKASTLKKLIFDIESHCKLKPDYISNSDSTHISFFVFCKLLDATHLSFLRNEMIKFRQSLQGDTFVYEHLLEIIELCLLKADLASNALFSEILPNKEFFTQTSQIETWDDLYFQSDKKTPVPHSGLFLLNKYGTKEVFELLCNQHNAFLINETEFIEWKNLREKGINEKIQQRAKLHQNWAEAKKPDENRKISKSQQEYANKIKDEYLKLCKEIERYEWLDNKLHFIHLKKLHNLTIEILSRLSGFMSLLNRDEVQVGKTHSFDITKDANNSTQLRKIRNFIAHYNFLSKTAADFSIIELINGSRQLMRYDRKLKNAITKAVIKIFDNHGMVLSLCLNANHEFEVEKISSKRIYHLGSKAGKYAIATEQVNKEYCTMCEALLKMKK